MQNFVWVLTKEINEYYQEGEYFLAVFRDKPSVAKLAEYCYKRDEEYLVHVESGGGRVGWENEWYYLRKEEV